MTAEPLGNSEELPNWLVEILNARIGNYNDLAEFNFNQLESTKNMYLRLVSELNWILSLKKPESNPSRRRILFLDTETSGTADRAADPGIQPDRWPHLVELAFILSDESGDIYSVYQEIIRPDGYEIPEAATKIHGISTEQALTEGIPLDKALFALRSALKQADLIVCHNAWFDLGVIRAIEARRQESIFPETWHSFCTMQGSTEYCAIPSPYGGFKWPKLIELHQVLFGELPDQEHRALGDVELTKKCFFKMVKIGLFDWGKIE